MHEMECMDTLAVISCSFVFEGSVGGVMIPVFTRFSNDFGGIDRPDLRGIRSKG